MYENPAMPSVGWMPVSGALSSRCSFAAERNRELFHSTELADAEDAEHYVGTEWNEQRVFDRYDWLFSYDATARPEPVQT